jgi:hypothetical protein
MDSEATPVASEHGRWIVLRDMLVFQFKLIVDGILDLVLLPVSLIVGLVSFMRGGPTPGAEFQELLRWGRRGERWINLFGAAERARRTAPDGETPEARDLDDLVSRVETYLADECRKRGVTEQTRLRLDAALDSLQRLGKRSKPD